MYDYLKTSATNNDQSFDMLSSPVLQLITQELSVETNQVRKYLQ